MNDLYDADILMWSEQQAALLRRLARGERVNGQIDWDNVAEEVESAGRGQLNAVESLLFQALVHMLKAEAWPLLRDAPNWRADAPGFVRRRGGGSRLPCASVSTLPVSTPTHCKRYPKQWTVRRLCPSRTFAPLR